MTKHSRQNRFAGSTGRIRPTPKGGVATVTPAMTIGAFPCWCQGELCWFDETGQHWEGKEKGAKHPRFRRLNEESEVSAVAVDERPTITAGELKGWHRDVQRLVMNIVNDHGVKWRFTGGSGQILLYPTDGESQPFRISQKRPAGDTVRYLRKFMEDWALTEPEPEKKEAPKPAPTPAVFSGRVEPRPVAPQVIPHERGEPDTAVWTRHISKDRGETDFETDGERFRCLLCKAEGVETILDSARSIGGHVRVKHRDTSTLYSEEARAKATESKRHNRLVKKASVHVNALAELLDLKIASDEKELAALRKEIDRLQSAVNSAERRADDAEAKVALLTEALAPFRGALEALDG